VAFPKIPQEADFGPQAVLWFFSMQFTETIITGNNRKKTNQQTDTKTYN